MVSFLQRIARLRSAPRWVEKQASGRELSRSVSVGMRRAVHSIVQGVSSNSLIL